MEDLPEAGYQYLPTDFTGKPVPQLSGNDCFSFILSDTGTAKSLDEEELQNPPGANL